MKKETLGKYAEQFNWDLINDSNIKEKFIEFFKKMDMSYSYKPVLLMSMLEQCDDNGKVLVEDVVEYFIDYYEDRKSRGLQAENKKSLYNDEVIDRKKAKSNIFSNLFKHFEDMRFLEKCKDVEYIQFNKKIWKKVSDEEKKWIYRRCEKMVGEYFGER